MAKRSKNSSKKKKFELNDDYIWCSFCSKSRNEVRYLVSGPDVYICDECAQITIEMLTEKGIKFNLPTTQPIIDIDLLGFKPRFNKLSFEQKHNHCFYLSPFREPFNTIYKDHIVPVVTTEDFTVERADDIFGTQPIIEDIWEAINSSSIILADVSTRNPNVMYEIGMAHTIGKPVVIITQDIEDIPFDLKHYRCIVYEYTPRGCKELENKLAGTLRFSKGSKHK